MLKAIVFDFDGVLVNSEPLHFQAFREVAGQFGLTFDYTEYLQRYVGFDDRDAFRHMLGEIGQPADEQRVAALCNQKQTVFETLADQGVTMVPGARELVEEATTPGALPAAAAIASGATLADIRLVLGELGLADRFEVIVAANHVAFSKPHPMTYALAVERLADLHPELGLEPGHCLAIEDTAAGIESAQGAGLMTLALTTTTTSDSLSRADRIEKDLSNVNLAALRAWYGLGIRD